MFGVPPGKPASNFLSSTARTTQISSGAGKGADPADGVREKLEARVGKPRLEGKVCIVTGAGSLKGIGRGSCIAFAQNGAAALYVTDFDQTNLSSLPALIENSYPNTRAIAQQIDAANAADVKGICHRALTEFGRLDVFFANAGVGVGDVLAKTSVEAFNRVVRVSAAMQVTSKGKTEAGDSFVCTASVAGMRSGAGSIEYSMSKEAVINLVASAAWQLSRTGVHVNAVNPGLTETGMTIGTFADARGRSSINKVGQLNPTGRYPIPEEIAAAVVFLASDDASYVSGQNLPVCGGLSASHPVVPGRFF